MIRAMLLAALTAFTPAALVAQPAPLESTSPAAPAIAAQSLVGPAPVAPAPVEQPAAGWQWPLTPAPAVVQSFHAPPTPWSAGHRGVDLAAAIGQAVLAAGAGRVTFAGQVAGRGVVVVTHAAGLRTSYEPVTPSALVGTAVQSGTPIGWVEATPGHCAPSTCLHWGLRREATYLDPLMLVGSAPPVLKPLAGLSRQ